jgi:hypothetical protein
MKVSKFTFDLLISLKNTSSHAKLSALYIAIQHQLNDIVRRDINIAIRMLEDEKFLYITDNFSNNEIMNEVHNEIFELLEIKK